MRYLKELVKVTHGLPGEGTPGRGGEGLREEGEEELWFISKNWGWGKSSFGI